MRSTQRRPWLVLALLALAAGIVARVLRRRLAAQQVTAAKTAPPGYRQTPFWRLYDQLAETLDHTYGWDKVPTPLGLLILLGLRNILRQHNLHDTTQEPALNQPVIEPMQARYLTARTADGTHNDLQNPAMGMAGSRFGRLPPTHLNTETHWWDASQLYGSSTEQQALRRSGRDGKLLMGDNGRLHLPADPALNPALVPGWWLGLELLVTVFTREHNAIC